MRILIAHYSLLGHTNCLAEAIMEGAEEIEGAEVKLMRVPEILSEKEKRNSEERAISSSYLIE